MASDKGIDIKNFICSHEDLRVLNIPVGYSICRGCGFAFYKDIMLIKDKNQSHLFINEIPTFTNNQTME